MSNKGRHKKPTPTGLQDVHVSANAYPMVHNLPDFKRCYDNLPSACYTGTSPQLGHGVNAFELTATDCWAKPLRALALPGLQAVEWSLPRCRGIAIRAPGRGRTNLCAHVHARVRMVLRHVRCKIRQSQNTIFGADLAGQSITERERK
jgi:hypothetical protein